jgi:spermidine/putrescine ABC transporter ATP-binding subunit
MVPDNIISIAAVSKLFGAVSAVDDVSFNIARGEFFSLLGASGCGKTTLLRMLAGFEQPSAGEIFIDGQPMGAVPPNRRPTNMVFQNYAIFPHLNVQENIGYGLRNKGLSREEARARVRDALHLVKLDGLGERASHQLSGGQRQRVALARALVCRPKVLLLDEPLGALDKKLREDMQIELRALQKTVGITFVFVTHDQEEALTLSDRIAVMSDGKVLQIDTPASLYERPNCRRVAEFIGTMNLFPGRVVHSSERKLVVEARGLGNVTALPSSEPVPAGGDVLVAVRPEKLMMSARRKSGDLNSFEGQIVDVSYRGDRSHFHVKAGGFPEGVAISQQNSSGRTQAAFGIGDTVWVSWQVEDGHVLTH